MNTEDLIEKILTITDDPRRDYKTDDIVTEKLSKLLELAGLNKLHIMQAEGSDVSEGAAVGKEREAKGVRDWQEDFAHENGNYQNKCANCGELFIGHKRRPLCKICG